MSLSTSRFTRIRTALMVCAVLSLGILSLGMLTACGSGGSGPGPDGTGQGLELVKFHQDGIDTVAGNTILRVDFSEPIDPNTVFSGSFVVKEGSSFGLQVPGTTYVVGSSIFFEPQLPSNCDLSDAGFKPGTDYRILITGHPEEFAVKNTRGQPLSRTLNMGFTTRPEGGVLPVFEDQIAGVGPTVTAMTPVDGAQAVSVATGNQIVLDISENLDPCTVTTDSVILTMVETGDSNLASNVQAPNGNQSGFYVGTDTSDQVPGPTGVNTWGASASVPVTPSQVINADVQIVQSQASTQIVVTPTFGKFPENALLVVQLTAAIQDFGGLPLTAYNGSFTTENLPMQSNTYVMEADGETPFDEELTTSDVDTERANSRIQGYLLLTGDGDNGPFAPTDTVIPPSYPNGVSCTDVPNDNSKDDFNPSGDVILDTGSTINACVNNVDGSTAVVWRFQNFTIPSGVTVRIVGVNPAIIHVQNDVNIAATARLLVRGDSGSPFNSDGRSGRYLNTTNSSPTPGVTGGIGVAGAGDGGDSSNANGSGPLGNYGQSGSSGYGSDDTLPNMGQNVLDGPGAGQGNVRVTYSSSGNRPTTGTSGGGGGHAEVGTSGTSGTDLGTLAGAADGAGGSSYGDTNATLRTPIAGAGGGGGGSVDYTSTSYQWYDTTGGSGGAGGGFVDITTQNGDINIAGTIDAAGGRGGSGAAMTRYIPNWQGSGAGGGGSGGGIRLLTPNNIVLIAATVTAAGGAGGAGATGAGGTANNGGAGSNGRIVMEADSITGIAGSTVSPTLGDAGFYSGPFDGSRFVGGGTTPGATSGLIQVGPMKPTYLEPVAADFTVGVPAGASNGPGKTCMLLEVRGYEMKPDGTADKPAIEPMWTTVGYFTDSGNPTSPNWIPLANPPLADIGGAMPADNDGLIGGMASLFEMEFVQFRLTCYLPSSMGPFDPGPYMDRWNIRFTSDQ